MGRNIPVTDTILIVLFFLTATSVLIDFQHVSHWYLLVQPHGISSKSLSTFTQKVPIEAFLGESGPRPDPHLYCRASLSAVALDSYFPTSMLILSALLLHSSRVMVRRSFWDLRCSIRLQRKKSLFHNFVLGLQLICQYFSHLL